MIVLLLFHCFCLSIWRILISFFNSEVSMHGYPMEMAKYRKLEQDPFKLNVCLPPILYFLFCFVLFLFYLFIYT